jgi:hypothetical protein
LNLTLLISAVGLIYLVGGRGSSSKASVPSSSSKKKKKAPAKKAPVRKTPPKKATKKDVKGKGKEVERVTDEDDDKRYACLQLIT